MNKIVIALCIVTASYAQLLQLSVDTVGIDQSSTLPQIAMLENLSDSQLTIDSLSIDSIDNEDVQLSNLMIQIHLGSGLFVKAKNEDVIQTIASAAVESNSSVYAQINKMQNQEEWLGFHPKDVQDFVATISLHTSQGDFSIPVGGIWVAEGAEKVSILKDLITQEFDISTEIQKEINVFTVNGRLVQTFNNIGLANIISQNLPNGVYFARIKDRNVTAKFIIK